MSVHHHHHHFFSVEPKSLWQQLTDEKSNYPYYWNTETNEVVWDMPSEFQQYLILHKEYEEKIEKGLREGKLKPENRPGAKREVQKRYVSYDVR